MDFRIRQEVFRFSARHQDATLLQQHGERGVARRHRLPGWTLQRFDLADAPVLIHVNVAPMSVRVFKSNDEGAGGLRPAPSNLALAILHPIREHDPRAVFLLGHRV